MKEHGFTVGFWRPKATTPPSAPSDRCHKQPDRDSHVWCSKCASLTFARKEQRVCLEVELETLHFFVAHFGLGGLAPLHLRSVSHALPVHLEHLGPSMSKPDTLRAFRVELRMSVCCQHCTNFFRLLCQAISMWKKVVTGSSHA